MGQSRLTLEATFDLLYTESSSDDTPCPWPEQTGREPRSRTVRIELARDACWLLGSDRL